MLSVKVEESISSCIICLLRISNDGGNGGEEDNKVERLRIRTKIDEVLRSCNLWIKNSLEAFLCELGDSIILEAHGKVNDATELLISLVSKHVSHIIRIAHICFCHSNCPIGFVHDASLLCFCLSRTRHKYNVTSALMMHPASNFKSNSSKTTREEVRLVRREKLNSWLNVFRSDVHVNDDFSSVLSTLHISKGRFNVIWSKDTIHIWNEVFGCKAVSNLFKQTTYKILASAHHSVQVNGVIGQILKERSQMNSVVVQNITFSNLHKRTVCLQHVDSQFNMLSGERVENHIYLINSLLRKFLRPCMSVRVGKGVDSILLSEVVSLGLASNSGQNLRCLLPLGNLN
mmetsp:Transcript_4546/g.17183  ORF Transcript_4546/g.17183 Transcript_4546/m.17183 type:complete len:345 (+) Transcript_4546:611-1645(+)